MVHTVNILGVELTEKCGFLNHIKNLTFKAKQSLYALRILKSHGPLGDSLQYHPHQCLLELEYFPFITSVKLSKISPHVTRKPKITKAPFSG